MAKNNELGVYQQKNGLWMYRYTTTIDGRRQEHKGTKDAFGNPLRTKKEAIKARDESRKNLKKSRAETPQITRRTLKEVYHDFCEKGRNDRAYTTKLKQDSLWDNHISIRYGNRFVDEITVAEINDYLSDLYYNVGFSYRYTESF